MLEPDTQAIDKLPVQDSETGEVVEVGDLVDIKGGFGAFPDGGSGFVFYP